MSPINPQAQADMKAVMARLSLTNRVMAAIFGVNEATVSRWVNGRQPIPHSIAVAIVMLEALSKGSEEKAKRIIAHLTQKETAQ